MEKYKKTNDYSYTYGLFPTFELVKNKKEQCLKILFHKGLTKTEDVEKLEQLANQSGIEIEENSKLVDKLKDKDNIFCIGVFKKYESTLQSGTNHIVLVNPSDMGNLGTIIRTCVGFNIFNIAIITPACDIFSPKTVRSSMGSLFSVNIQTFESFEDYQEEYSNNIYTFMLQAKTTLQSLQQTKKPFSLVFGNESSGLPIDFLQKGEAIIINHTNKIDSLNLPISVACALYEFGKHN